MPSAARPVSSGPAYPVSSGPVAYPVTSLPPAAAPRRSRPEPSYEAPARDRSGMQGEPSGYRTRHAAPNYPSAKPAYDTGDIGGVAPVSSYPSSSIPAQRSYGGSPSYQGSSSYQGSGSYPLSGAYPTVSEPARPTYPVSGSYPTVNEPAQPTYPAPWGVEAPTPQRPSWDSRTGARARFAR
jgi:hypothetical protein